MEIHIGKLIKEQVEISPLTKSEFARKIDKFPQNINEVFSKKSIDTDLLIKISDALNHDFFQYYRNEVENSFKEPAGKYGVSKKGYEVSITIKVNDPAREAEILKMIGVTQ